LGHFPQQKLMQGQRPQELQVLVLQLVLGLPEVPQALVRPQLERQLEQLLVVQEGQPERPLGLRLLLEQAQALLVLQEQQRLPRQ
jgi:hypothetical protein